VPDEVTVRQDQFAGLIDPPITNINSLKAPYFVRWQGAIRFKSGAYTLVREHFEAACDELSRVDCNTASGQNMGLLTVFDYFVSLL
jgi:hypothetical protein